MKELHPGFRDQEVPTNFSITNINFNRCMMNKFLKVLLVFYFFSLASCVNSKSFENNSEYLAAKNGNVDAQYNVAMNFLNGLDGFPMDEKKAKKWFEAAAEKGDASAQNGLGIMYLRGMGGRAEYRKS